MSVQPADGARRFEIRPPVAREPRNCCRCGSDFMGCDLERICSACRKPRNQAARGLKTEMLGQPLSIREKQIVGLVYQAKANKEIAHELHLGEGTIKVYMSSIFCKLGVENRTALAMWAVEHKEAIQ